MEKAETFGDGVGLQRVALLAGLALLAALAVWMLVSQFAGVLGSGPGQGSLGVSQVAFEDETGVRVLLLAITAGGGMIDLRYQVVDPDKAVIVHDEENPPRIVDEASGQVSSRPWMVHDARDLHTAVTYHELIMNAGGHIKRGSKVTIAIGDSRLEHVIVQ